MKKQQSGFTLIELVLVIIVLGVLAATAVPKFVNIKDDAQTASFNAAKAGVGSAFALVLADKQGSPSVQDIADALRGTDGTDKQAAATGVQVSTDGGTTWYTALTYKDDGAGNCTVATAAATDVVCDIADLQ